MNPQRPPITWTQEKLKILRDYYPTIFNDALALWLKVSVRSMQRKAKELGLKKVEGFNTVKAQGISDRISEGVKRAYAEGRKEKTFIPGVRNNPEYEFRPGHRFDDKIEEARKDAIRKTFKKRKMLKIYGLQ